MRCFKGRSQSAFSLCSLMCFFLLIGKLEDGSYEASPVEQPRGGVLFLIHFLRPAVLQGSLPTHMWLYPARSLSFTEGPFCSVLSHSFLKINICILGFLCFQTLHKYESYSLHAVHAYTCDLSVSTACFIRDSCMWNIPLGCSFSLQWSIPLAWNKHTLFVYPSSCLWLFEMVYRFYLYFFLFWMLLLLMFFC